MNRREGRRSFGPVLAAGLLLAGLGARSHAAPEPVHAAAQAADADWRRVEPGLELVFPADHGAHPDTRIEWWYVTGQLEAADGRDLGFQLTVFRQGLDPRPPRPGDSPLRARQAFLGHLALTDVSAGRTRFAERLRRGGNPLARASTTDLDLVLEDWSLRREPSGRLALAAGDPGAGIALDLVLEPEKPLVLHGERGYSAKGEEPGNASAYVSWTRLAAKGRVGLGGELLDVAGQAWFDHEFGSSVLGAGVVGWDWFGLQLDDGRELMLFVLRDERGRPTAASAGTLVERDGTARHLTRGDFRVEVRDRWRSARTGAEYPARWTLAVPAHGLELDVRPRARDAELPGGGPTGVAYWEGPVAIRGSATGRGYAELTGYAGSLRARF